MESGKSSSDEIVKLINAVQAKEASIHTLKLRLEETIADLSESNQLEAKHLRDQKHFVHFLYQLSLAQSLEELLLIAAEQFEMNSSARPQIFIMQYQRFEAKYYEVMGHTVHTKFGEPLHFTHHFGLMPEEQTQKLANFFGRPLGAVYFFQAYVPTIRKFIPDLEFLIIFESFKPTKPEIVVTQLQNYVDLLSLVLDRQLLRYHSYSYVAAWEKTFDSFKDPICIKDLSGIVLRSNTAYQKKMNLMMDYEIHSHTLMDPRTKVPRAVIELYINKTEFEELRRKQVLSEKMTALGKMAGNIAHELNNPLSGILSMSQVLKQEMTDPKFQKIRADLDEVQKATVRCQKIIADLTQFSLGEDQSQTEFRTSADECIEVVMSLLKSALRRHHVDVILKTKEYWMDVPAQLFQQVMFNLINNACQAMADGGNLEIRTDIAEGDGKEMCVISISDSGPGIPEEIGLKIFDPFFTTKVKGEGTGLGLHLSKLIIEKYKGKIHFETSGTAALKTKFIVKMPVCGSLI